MSDASDPKDFKWNPDVEAKKIADREADRIAANEAVRAAANRLHHCSMLYAGAMMELAKGQPVGMIAKDYPGLHGVRDFVDLILLTRAEINAIGRLLLEAKLIDEVAMGKAFATEYEWFAGVKAEQFGATISDAGVVFTNPKPDVKTPPDPFHPEKTN